VSDIDQEVIAFEFPSTQEDEDSYIQKLKIWVKYGPEKMRPLDHGSVDPDSPDFAFGNTPLHRERLNVEPEQFPTFIRPDEDIVVSKRTVAGAIKSDSVEPETFLRFGKMLNAFTFTETYTLPEDDPPYTRRIVYIDQAKHLERPLDTLINALLYPSTHPKNVGTIAKAIAKTSINVVKNIDANDKVKGRDEDSPGFWERVMARVERSS
jgi:hypothetical protein